MKWKLIESQEEFQQIIERHNRESEYVVLDLETTGLDSFKDKILEVQINGFSEDMVYIAPGDWAHCLRNLRARPVGHNLRFDITFLYRAGIDCLHWQYHDTLLLGHLANENRESYSLDSYVKELWNDNYKEEFWKKYKTYQEAPKEEAWEYAAKDIYYTRRLYDSLKRELKEQGIPDSLVTHTHRLQYALLRTEIAGIQVDVEYLTSLGVKLKSQIETLKPKMRSVVEDYVDLVELEMWLSELEKRSTPKGKAGVKRPEFSFDSSKQLQSLLYNQMGLPAQRNEKTKAISVDDSSLEKLKGSHPIIELIQEYRGANKVYGSFVEGTLDRLHGGRIYPEFRVSGTVTGRISSSNPNMQQLPRSGGVRGIYTPDPGYVLISADYASLEIYIAANFTKDKNLLKIVCEGESMHDVTARNLGIDRQLAKSINFAEGYGCSHYKVAKLLGVSEKEGQRVHNLYWQTYSGQRKLMDECSRKVDRGEPIVTPWGRKRRFEVAKRNPWDRAYRQSWNFLVQSTGADCTNKAFYIYSEHLEKTKRGRGWFVLHDEIIAEVKPEYAEEELKNLCKIMADVGDQIGLEVRLKAEPSGPSDRWLD